MLFRYIRFFAGVIWRRITWQGGCRRAEVAGVRGKGTEEGVESRCWRWWSVDGGCFDEG